MGNTEIYNRENLMGPFLVHKLLGPRTPPPPPLPILPRAGPHKPVSQTPALCSNWAPRAGPTHSTAGRLTLLTQVIWHKLEANLVHPHPPPKKILF